MKFRLSNWSSTDICCFDELSALLNLTRAEDGMPLSLQKAENPGCQIQDGQAVIFYAARHQIWRELGILSEHQGKPFSLRETPAYRDLGVMLDCSRNGVLTEDAVKDLTRYLALMGYSSIQLYTEDTYHIDGQPYFGYQRGAYTQKEFHSMDAYTAMFGIEMVPCIQTLAHLDCVLRWKAYEDVQDFGNILLADEEKSYDLIRQMFSQMSNNLRSRRINIGMDEAHMLGLGRHLDLHGYEDRTKIMMRHYRKVMDIARSFGYQPMMWSDMFFRLATHGQYYTDQKLCVDASVREAVGEDITLVYWDYYTLEESKYDHMFASHKQITPKIAFAGGAWKWEGPCPNAWYTRAVARPAHRSCRRNGVEQVLITAWGDNGDECPIYGVLPAFQQWAELCYADHDEDVYMQQRFRTCTGGSYDDFLHLGDAVLMPDNPAPGRCGVNPVRYLLYQDLLGGLFDAHTDEAQRRHLWDCTAMMEQCRDRAPEKWKYLFQTQYLLDHLLAQKCMLGNEIREAYAKQDKPALLDCRAKALALLPCIDEVIKATQDQWLRENKIFGLEVLQLQFGGLKERIHFASNRLEAFVQGHVEKLDELEEEALPFYGQNCKELSVVTPPWGRIASAANH